MAVDDDICPICMVRNVSDYDSLLNLRNKKNEPIYFECLQCKNKACSFCIIEHYKVNEQFCPFCRYTGIREGRSRIYFNYKGEKKVAWVYRSIISSWDDPEIDSSDDESF